MKNVLAFMLGMAATIVTIKLVTKDGDDHDYYDDWEDDDMFFNYGGQNKPIETAKQKAERERKQARKELLAELDYELQSLSHAISTQDKTEQTRAKARLDEIRAELEELK